MSYAPGATVVATGMLPILIMASAVLTAPVSIFLLWRYRRAVVRSMAAETRPGAAQPAADANTPAPASAQAPALSLKLIDAAAIDAANPPLYRQALKSLVSATGVYTAAGFLYALVLTSAWLYFTGDDGVPLTRFLWLMSCYVWPTALAVGMLAAVSRGQRIAVAVAYFSMLFAVAIYGLLRNQELTAGQLATFWLFTNAPATLLLLAFLHRRVRAVGPLVLSFMVVAVVGSQVLLNLVSSTESSTRAAIAVGSVFGLGGHGVFWGLMLLGFGLFGVGGWFLLKWLGRRYQARRMSDQSLTFDAMWLLFGVVQSITFAFEGWVWFFTGLVAFAIYKAATGIGFALTRGARAADASPTLLLLRVFALGSRSERLFDALSKRWLRAGPISMIAGPDLVTATVEPHEFLEFMGGDLSRRFVRGGDDLERRLGAMERGPDPDGRYRVNEFFCYADTWKETMARLATGADAVLMDLRGFSRSNQGCLFELQQLVDSVDLQRVTFLLDEKTDRDFLEQTLRESWLRTTARSGRPTRAPDARLVKR
ncbi:MAG: hypothetical protein ACXW2I_07515 [Burkholderiales bacterium]